MKETLELILGLSPDLLSTLTENSWLLALIFLAEPLLDTLVSFAVIGVAVFALVIGVRLLHANLSGESRLREIRDLLEIGSRGYYSGNEHADVIRRIKRLLKETTQ